MKTKSFKEYLEKHLDKHEIAEIEEQAEREVKILRSIQALVTDAIEDYMKKNKIGFNELVRRLDSTPSHVARMQRGEANLTLSSLAHVLLCLEKNLKRFSKEKNNDHSI